MNDDLKKRLAQGQPVRGEPVRVGPIGNYGIIYEYPDYGNQRSIRYYSTNDEAILKAAILLLVCSEIGFEIVIDDTAYKTNKKTKLAVGRGMQWCGAGTPDHDFWVRLSVEDESGGSPKNDRIVHKTPEEAVANFFHLWKQLEIGDAWIDANFSGHGCPNFSDDRDDDNDVQHDEATECSP